MQRRQPGKEPEPGYTRTIEAAGGQRGRRETGGTVGGEVKEVTGGDAEAALGHYKPFDVYF